MEYKIKVIGAPGAYDTLEEVLFKTEQVYYLRECDVVALTWNNKKYLAITKNAPTTMIHSKDFCIKIWRSTSTIMIDLKGKSLLPKEEKDNPEDKYFIVEYAFEPHKEYKSNF